MVLIPFLLSAGFGFALWICARAVAPRPEPVTAVLARLDQLQPDQVEDSSLADRLGPRARRLLQDFGLKGPEESDLQVVGRTEERHAIDKVASGLVGLFGTAVVVLLLGAVGISLPLVLQVSAALATAGFGFVLPDLKLREEAAEQRREFRHVLSAFLDLVNILLAGGAGIETALFAAADAGEGWAFGRLRTALDRSRRIGQSPWDGLSELGRSLSVAELSELAASVALAGSHGARIRSSLAAKADALRGHQLAETESAAESATERMTIPLSILLCGFLVLIAYPAISQISSSTGG
jgi:tight adherence protein C